MTRTPQDPDSATRAGSLTPEQFARVRAIFEAALEQPARNRSAFVEGACLGDAALLREVEAMLAADATVAPLLDRPPSTPGSSAPQEGRFPAGTVLAGRYRILGRLGQGGMGEVYRAHDLILNQTVALKFLVPAHLSEAALARFRNEVRIARQVSHPHVCRVYDLGMVEGLHFLSMEYIDGEDLASLLRRIGRLPQDKAIEFTRKICAGLSAAHERGVLHRDLKPANIMIDGRGQPRITDFGLAGLAAEIPLSDLRSGTPAYMSPEQKAGRDVTIRSDLFSLGLVLHEMFTGKARKDTQSNPTDLVKDLDPAIERLILRCLEEEPKRRPSSAISVAMALPGGDPIAAALAAGETPSPEMVAAAGGTGVISPAVGALCLAAIALGIAAATWMSQRTLLTRYVPITRNAEAMAERARGIARDLGYSETPADAAFGYELDQAFLDNVQATDPSPDRWEVLRSERATAIKFSYRHGLRILPPIAQDIPVNAPPDETLSVVIDPAGRLAQLVAIPSRREGSLSPPSPADWGALFRNAGLEIDRFTETSPTRVPPAYADQVRAWEGELPDLGDVPVRIEAAALAGRPVHFDLITPWSTDAPTTPGRTQPALRQVSFPLIVVVALLLARRNLTIGRADRRGALRTAGAMGIAVLLQTLLTGRRDFSGSVISTAVVWLGYVTLEPYARRVWPEMLVAWNRLLSGRVRDPLVGREILVGTMAGVALAVVYHVWFHIHIWAGEPPPVPMGAVETEGRFTILALMGGPHVIGAVPAAFADALGSVILGGAMLVLLAMLLRRRHLAAVAWVVVWTVQTHLGLPDNPLSGIAFSAVVFTIGIVVLVRFGVLALVAHLVPYYLLTSVALRFDAAAPWAASSYVLVGTVVVMALYGFHTALGTRSIFGETAPDERPGAVW